jgi:hypothetical protein
MVWRESFLDLILIPLSLLLPMLYHAWLYRAVRRHPLSTAFGVYSASRRVWISGMMKVRTHHLSSSLQQHTCRSTETRTHS